MSIFGEPPIFAPPNVQEAFRTAGDPPEPPPLGSLESLPRVQLLMLGGEQEKVHPLVRMGMGLLSNRDDQFAYLQAMFPEATEVTDQGDGSGFVIWRDTQVRNPIELRMVQNHPVVGRWVTTDEQGRNFYLKPTVINPGGIDRGDFAELGPQGIAIGAAMAAGFATANPLAIGAVDAAIQATIEGLGQFGTPGKKFSTGPEIAERIVGAGVGGAALQVPANIFGRVQQARRGLPQAASQIAGEARAGGTFPTENIPDLVDELGRAVPDPLLSQVRRVGSRVSSAIGRAGEFAQDVGRAAAGRGARASLQPGEDVAQALGPAAADVIRRTQNLRRVEVFDPATQTFRTSELAPDLAQVTKSRMAEDLKARLAQRPEVATRNLKNEAEVRLLVDRYIQNLQPERLTGRATPRSRFEGAPEGVGEAERLGRRVAATVRRQVSDRQQGIIDTGKLIGRAHAGMEGVRIFQFDNQLARIDELLGSRFEVEGPVRDFLLAQRKRMEEAGAVDSRNFNSVLTNYGQRIKRRLLSETDSTQAGEVASELYDALLVDLDDAIARGKQLGRPDLDQNLDLLREARTEYGRRKNDLREFRQSVFARIIRQVDEQPGRGMTRAQPVSPERTIAQIERLDPSQQRELFRVLREADPATTRRIKSVLAQRLFNEALEETAGGRGIRSIEQLNKVMRSRQNRARFQVLLGTQRAKGLNDVSRITSLLAKSSTDAGGAEKFWDVAKKAGFLRAVAYAATSRYMRAAARVQMLGTKNIKLTFDERDAALMLTEPDARGLLIKALRAPKGGPARFRAFLRLSNVLAGHEFGENEMGEALQMRGVEEDVAAGQLERGEPPPQLDSFELP